MNPIKPAKILVMDDLTSVLERGVEKIYPSREALEKLLQQRKVRLYLGIDPTGRLHLGHTIPLRKLQEFADLGHEAILLVGTGTVLVGDPSQRSKARKQITEEEIQKNVDTWKQQAEKIVDFSKVQIKRNSDWLLKLTMKDLIKIAANISAIQLFKREMFQERLKRGDTVWAHETLYPLLQGYDSVALDVDLEIGGTDQTFNMLIGRELMQKMRGKEKYVLTVPMILGTDGKPMSKTSGNCVWLEDPPTEMYGKLMSIPDEQINSYLTLTTDLSRDQLNKTQKLSALNQKKFLAYSVVKLYHGEDLAKDAQEEFERVIQEKKPPSKPAEITSEELYKKIVERYQVPTSGVTTMTQAVATSANISTSEARRRVEGGTVSLDQLRMVDPQAPINLNVPDDRVLKVSSREYIKIKGRKGKQSKKSK